jgi:hypothetical protein
MAREEVGSIEVTLRRKRNIKMSMPSRYSQLREQSSIILLRNLLNPRSPSQKLIAWKPTNMA